MLPAATVTLRGPDEARVTQSDGNGNYAFPAVPAGAYSVTAALSGFSDANLEGIIVTDGPVEAPPITLSIASFGDTVVVTASRTEVRVVDAPVTTSVVSAATLETTASSNVGDVLRSVPGVNVIQLSARDVQVTSRQSTGTVTNSQLVLVDGRSTYLDFFPPKAPVMSGRTSPLIRPDAQFVGSVVFCVQARVRTAVGGPVRVLTPSLTLCFRARAPSATQAGAGSGAAPEGGGPARPPSAVPDRCSAAFLLTTS